jgi:hypothetical protein
LRASRENVFSIGDGILKVALEDAWSVKLHEKVLPDFIRNLKASIVQDRVVKDPVVVDEETLVILDGMHRVVALRELGYSYVPCCLIDYKLPRVQLGAWYRLITGDASVSQIVKLTQSTSSDLILVKTDSDNVYDMVEKKKAVGAILTSDLAWLITTKKSLDCKKAYDLIYQIEGRLRSANLKISYQTESDAKTEILIDKSVTCLVVPTLTKDDVLRVALKGGVFAPKATRHVFPFRMLGLNVPLELLDAENNRLTEANEKLQRVLSSRRLIELPGGQLVNGRRYEEPIYIFED